MQKMSEAVKTVVTTRNSFARATRRTNLKSNLKIEDKENNSPGSALKSERKKLVETKKRQKHIKNAIKKHGQTISQKPYVKEEISLNTRCKQRSYIEINDYEEEVEQPEVITQKKYVNFGHLLTQKPRLAQNGTDFPCIFSCGYLWYIFQYVYL